MGSLTRWSRTGSGLARIVIHRRQAEATSSIFEPLIRPYTPTRRFLSTRGSLTNRAMNKPPSILVYTGDQHELYNRIRESLTRVIPNDRYTVFNISSGAIKKHPWIEPNTACLLIADTSGLDDVAWSRMQSYFNQAGKIIFICQNRLLASLSSCESSKKQADILRVALGHRESVSMGKDFEHFLKKSLKVLTKKGEVNEKFHSKDLPGGLSYSVVLKKSHDCPLFLYMENSAHQAAAVFSDATPDQLLAPESKILYESLLRVGVSATENPPLIVTSGVMVSKSEEALNRVLGIRYGEEIGLQPKLFLRSTAMVRDLGLPEPNRNLLPIEVRNNCEDNVAFDFKRFFSKLTTSKFGHICLHVPVTTTTMDISSSLDDAIPTLDGAVVVASQQISGQGRGGNEFCSPIGAAMFTVSLDISKSSAIAQNPSFVQHIFAVSIADAVHILIGLEKFPIRIKWPNDIYFNRSHKLGGLLATARCRDHNVRITLGAGLNVANSHPTVCLNDIVPSDMNYKFTVEEVVAESLNRLEYWMNVYEINGRSEFLKKYYEYWLHDREEVILEEIGEKVMIRGLDEYGYLQVRSKNNPSKLFSVGDNGNTFDMMKGLIRHKF